MFTIKSYLGVGGARALARLEGYPGADFFWPVLAGMLQDHTNYKPAKGEEG